MGSRAASLASLEVAHPDAPEEHAAQAAADHPAEIPTPLAEAGSIPSLAPTLGAGRPLPASLGRELAPGAGPALERIRLHTGEQASAAAAAFEARAFTYGRDIVFGRDAYAPDTAAGRRLIAHELAHATQQATRGRVFRDPAPVESAADVDQRVLKGMIDLVARYPTDDDARLEGLVTLFASVPQNQIVHLHGRLEPGAKTDDFAVYFKDKFPTSRRLGLGYLRGQYAGKFAGKSGPVSADLGQKTADAAKQFMNLGVAFGRSMHGQGWYLNPKFWDIRYILRKGSRTKAFPYKAGADKPLKQAQDHAGSTAEWNVPGVEVDIEIRFGRFGPSAAIRDLFSGASSAEYAFECLNAAWMIELRGRYMSYPDKTRDVDFDREFESYLLRFTPSATTRSNDADFEEVHPGRRIYLSDEQGLKDFLKVGDETTISNPFMPDGHAFRNENVIYLGDLKFQGHPFGSALSPRDYARKLIATAQGNTEDEKIAWVLSKSSIGGVSRPKVPPP